VAHCTHLSFPSLPGLLLLLLLQLELCCLFIKSPLCCFKGLQAPLFPPVPLLLLLLLLWCGSSGS
jgi:hypothetical protein